MPDMSQITQVVPQPVTFGAMIFQFHREIGGMWEYLEVHGGKNVLRFPMSYDEQPPRQFSVDPWNLDE